MLASKKENNGRYNTRYNRSCSHTPTMFTNRYDHLFKSRNDSCRTEISEVWDTMALHIEWHRSICRFVSPRLHRNVFWDIPEGLLPSSEKIAVSPCLRSKLPSFETCSFLDETDSTSRSSRGELFGNVCKPLFVRTIGVGCLCSPYSSTSSSARIVANPLLSLLPSPLSAYPRHSCPFSVQVTHKGRFPSHLVLRLRHVLHLPREKYQ